MKTQVQHIYDILKSGYAPEKVVSWLLRDEQLILEKDKEQIKDAYKQGTCHHGDGYTATEYYEETFKANER